VSSAFTRAIGPSLFRTGLSLRNRLTRPETASSYALDMIFLLPYSQKLLSLAIYEESKIRMTAFQKKIAESAANEDVFEAIEDPTSDSKLKTASAKITSAVSHTEQLSEIRMDVFNGVLRPSLLPTEQWGRDVEEAWRYKIRLVAWLRTELIIAKYGPFLTEAMVAFPSLRQSPQLQSTIRRRFMMDLMHRGIINMEATGTGDDTGKFGNDTSIFHRLPKSDTVIKAFGMQDWAVNKDTQSVRQSMLAVAQQLGGTVLQQDQRPSAEPSSTSRLLNHAVISPETDLSDTSLEDILEVVTGGYIANCGPLNAICQEANFYQMWTHEYVQHLGDYLMQRCANEQTTILDVGAGDGLLIQCLRDFMDQKAKSNHKKRKAAKARSGATKPTTAPTLVATDDMSWNIFVKAQVEKLSVEAALEKYAVGNQEDTKEERPKQVIVLCSWMPMGEDWTSIFRAAGVDEYILIGESDDGSCGHNWKTWGNPTFRDGRATLGEVAPPYKRDGYNRWDMDVLTPFQFSSFDCAVSKSSKTVSFRREGG
ncbi:MAG: hypothetical protein SGILL_002786, partial [Bacillariaceae sp.]